MISSDGGDLKLQRTEGKEGRRSATLGRQEDRRERRRKCKNVINEIIPRSTSIRVHSAGALHTERRAGGGGRIESIEEITEWMRVFLRVSPVITKGQRRAKPLLCLHYCC